MAAAPGWVVAQISEALAGCRGRQHQIGRDVQDRKPQEGLHQPGRLLVGERVRAAQTGGLNIELLQNLDRERDVPDGENVVGAGGFVLLSFCEAGRGSPFIAGRASSGKMHLQKGHEYVNALRVRLTRNPNASADDRTVAQRLLQDRQDALAGGP